VRAAAGSGVIPVVIGVDLEPDGPGHEPVPGPWPGAGATHQWLEDQRAGMAGLTGRPAHFTWFLRIDTGMADAFGSAAHAVDVHPDLVADVNAQGDELGIHVHGWRRDPDGSWVDDFGDPGWFHDCVETALDVFATELGRPCRISRLGNRFLSPAVADQLAAAGVVVDLTAEPATVGVADGDWPQVRGVIPDYRRVPRAPHRLAPGLIELPLTASSKRLGASPRAHLSRMRRHGVTQRLDLPMQFGKAAPEDDDFTARVQRSLRSQRRPYLAFAVRSDGILDPRQRPRLLSHMAQLLAMPEAPQFAFVTPSEAVDLLDGG